MALLVEMAVCAAGNRRHEIRSPCSLELLEDARNCPSGCIIFPEAAGHVRTPACTRSGAAWLRWARFSFDTQSRSVAVSVDAARESRSPASRATWRRGFPRWSAVALKSVSRSKVDDKLALRVPAA